MALERVTLYGLPIVSGRKVAYGRIDPELARELFIRRALVEGDWETRHPFFAANQRRLADVDELEQRARRRDIFAGDEALFAFYDARIPAEIVSAAHFDRWWRDARRAHPDLLDFTPELLVAGDAALDARARPEVWKQGELALPLSYRFEPGAEHDGVTVHVPLTALPRLRATGFDWHVPAFREELVTALIRSLPKEHRRALVPVPDVAAAVVERLQPRRGRLVDQVARELEALRGVRVTADAFDRSRLPAHLRMRFRIEDEAGRPVAEGDDLEALKGAAQPRLRSALGEATAGLERRGLRAWTLGELPRSVALAGTGDAVRAYPALVDEGDSVAVRTLDTPEAQAAAMWAGTRRLLLLGIAPPARHVQAALAPDALLSLAVAPHGSVAAVLEDATAAAADALIAEAGGPAWDAAGFARLRDHVAGELVERTTAVARDAARVLRAESEVRGALERLTAPAFQPAARDVSRQLGRLVFRGFIAAAGAARLPDLERYLRAAARRLERLPDAVATDADRMRAIAELEAAWRARLDAWPPGRPVPAALRDVKWMLEELRVSHFAQGLGVRGPVSSKRIRRAIAEA